MHQLPEKTRKIIRAAIDFETTNENQLYRILKIESPEIIKELLNTHYLQTKYRVHKSKIEANCYFIFDLKNEKEYKFYVSQGLYKVGINFDMKLKIYLQRICF